MDDSVALPTLPIRRVCAKKGCRRDARPGGGKLCRPCHALSTKKWRTNRKSTAPPREACASSSSAAVARRVALLRAIQRKQIVRGECIRGFGHGKTTGYFPNEPDPEAKGLDRFAGVIWICQACRHDFLSGAARELQAREEVARDQAARAANAQRIEDAAASIEDLEPAVRAAIEESASRGPLGVRLHPTSPLYQQRLATLVERERARGSSSSSSEPSGTN